MNRINLARLEQVGRGATIKIAASNATEKSKAAADYVCDGAADDVEINAAIQELDGIGGCVELSEGTFNLRPGEIYAVLLNVDNVWLKGQGKATILGGSLYSKINIQANGVQVSDISHLGEMFVDITDGMVIVRDCSSRLLVIEAGKTSVTGCVFSDYIHNYGELIILNSISPVIQSFATIIPPTVELIKGTNNIPLVRFEEEE